MKHLFFDLDRTLWDFDRNSETALSLIYENLKLGDHLRSFQSFHTKYKKVNGELWDQYSKGKITKDDMRVRRFHETLTHFGVKNKTLACTIADDYVSISPHQTLVFPDTFETLDRLANDNFSLHIITNGFSEVQHIKLDKSGLKKYFDVVLCSEDIGKNKPARIVFDHALNLASAKAEESIMIGDSYEADVVGAENAGIKAILFDPHRIHRRGRHTWHIHELKAIPETIPWMI